MQHHAWDAPCSTIPSDVACFAAYLSKLPGQLAALFGKPPLTESEQIQLLEVADMLLNTKDEVIKSKDEAIKRADEAMKRMRPSRARTINPP